MCTSSPKEDLPKGGEKWFIGNKEFTIGTLGQKYYDTNGDPDKLYMSMRGPEGECYIITMDAFVKKARREAPRIELFITPDQIMRAKPCEAGARFLYKHLGIKFENDPYLDGATLAASGKRSLVLSVQELYMAYYLGNAPDTWLVFLAKVLKLIPEQSCGPDRTTLKRLLGIKS